MREREIAVLLLAARQSAALDEAGREVRDVGASALAKLVRMRAVHQARSLALALA